MIRRPPRSTLDRSSAASDVYKRQVLGAGLVGGPMAADLAKDNIHTITVADIDPTALDLSLIHISEPTRPY